MVKYQIYQVGDGNNWIVQPLALTKLALLLMEIEKEHKNRDSKPMVIGVDDESSGNMALRVCGLLRSVRRACALAHIEKQSYESSDDQNALLEHEICVYVCRKGVWRN